MAISGKLRQNGAMSLGCSRWWVFGVLVICSSWAYGVTDPDPQAAIRAELQAELEDFSQPDWNHLPLSLPPPPEGSPFVPDVGAALAAYRERLVQVGDWSPGPVWHQVGTIPLIREGAPTVRLGVNVFFPKGVSRGTLLFVHGYMSHAASFAYTEAFFVAHGWTVTTLDLPGHGLSTGPRADVDSFVEYGDAVVSWLTWVRAQAWPGPQVLLAHSLGTAACLEALRRPSPPKPDRVVFCAPLIRPTWYPLLALGDVALRWWMQSLPSTFGWDGYLDDYEMPIHWFEALQVWLSSLDRQEPLDLPLTIYSGDQDTVVDAAWNRSEYERLVPRVKYVVLPGKNHLFLANREDRVAFHQMLWDSLNTDSP